MPTKPVAPSLESPVKLTSSALRPVMPEEQRARVVEAVIGAIKGSALGTRISTKKVRTILEQQLDRFCDGVSFDFGPIVQHALRVPGVSPADCASAVHRLKLALAREALSVLAPELPAVLPRPKNAPVTASRLGAMLLEARLVTAGQLDRALQLQASFGGRLGSHLLKIGAIAEGALAHFLALQLNVPAVDRAQLDALTRDQLRAIPSDLARKHRVVALGMSRGALKVAMVDPKDKAALEELAAATGHKILPMIAAETHLLRLLEDHYGALTARPREISVASIDVGGGEDFQVVHTSQRADRPRRKPEAEARPDLRPSEPPSAGAAVSLEDRGHFFQTERPDLLSDASNLEDLAMELSRVGDEAAVLRTALRMLSTAFQVCFAMSADAEALSGSAQLGCAIPDEELKKVRLLQKDTRLCQRAAERGHVSGAVAETEVDRRLLMTLGLDADKKLVCVPIGERGSVGFLLASNYRGEDPRDAVALAETVRIKAAIALEIVGLKRKLRA